MKTKTTQEKTPIKSIALNFQHKSLHSSSQYVLQTISHDMHSHIFGQSQQLCTFHILPMVYDKRIYVDAQYFGEMPTDIISLLYEMLDIGSV